MTSQEFHIQRLADLHTFFRLTFKGRWSNHIRTKLGHTAHDTLLPGHRGRARYISLRVLSRLEAYAASLGFKPLSSENGGQPLLDGRCPKCRVPISVILTATHEPACVPTSTNP